MNKNGSNAVVSSYHYQLRADGKRSSVTDGTGTSNYTYDDQGKLTQEAGPYATIAYTYDNVGNRLTRTVTGSTTALLPNGITNTAYDANDRIVGHTYDANGSETTVNGQPASYDFENHLVSLGSVANYVYDADGNRYSASNLGTTTSYTVDTSLSYASVVEEYSNGSLAARYDYGDDLVRMDRGSGVYYYLYDGLGSTRQLINTGGAVTDTWGYSAFGELASHTGGTVNPFLFNAQQFDGASGNYYLRARYYDQSVGRLISQDPFEGDSQDPVSLHRYLYASQDPVDRDDPSGRFDGLVGFQAAIFGVAYLAAQNFSVVQNAFVFAVSVLDPEAGISLGETMPQAEGGAELGAFTNAAFRKSGSVLYGQFREAVQLIEKSGIGTRVEQAFDELYQLRKILQLPSIDSLASKASRSAQGTLAKLEIDGEEFYGKNAHRQPQTILKSPNATEETGTLSHAEGDVFRQAAEAGLGKDSEAVLYSDRPLCGLCGLRGGVKSLGRQLGLKKLTIYQPGSEAYIITDFTKFREKQ